MPESMAKVTPDWPAVVEPCIHSMFVADCMSCWVGRCLRSEEYGSRQADARIGAEAQVERLQDLLADIYLYIDWRYITKQQTTEQKNLFADAVESQTEMVPERWWAPDNGREVQQ